MNADNWNVSVDEQYGVWIMRLYRFKGNTWAKVDETTLNRHVFTPRRFWGRSIDERIAIEAERFREMAYDIELNEQLQRNRSLFARRQFVFGSEESER